jgi:mono/diheme cytochrome c family protein
MSSNGYQYTLIAAGVIATVLFAIFWQRELFPEYKIYQNDYLALEKFRSSYTHEPIPPFQEGIKQIVFERKDNGPPGVERCISCHVTLDIPYFSPTKLEYDVNGSLVLDEEGRPIQIANEDYIWKKLEADNPDLYKRLKTADVGDYTYDVTKVLKMHPLIGRETRPFEYHPMNEYGCVSCHNGNGQGLTTEKAHGPVFDGKYEVEFEGPEPAFTESDLKNDPRFSTQFNHKPGEGLVFQTSPLFVGTLVQAKCMNCHQNSSQAMLGAFNLASGVIERRKKQSNAIQNAVNQEKEALVSLLEMQSSLESKGLEKTLNTYKQLAQQYTLPEKERLKYVVKSQYLENAKTQKAILDQIKEQIQGVLGSSLLANELYETIDAAKKQNEKVEFLTVVNAFIDQNAHSPQATGPLFEKLLALELEKNMIRHVEDTESSFEKSVMDQKVISSISSEVDLMTSNYHRGEQLFLSQACYACHKIAGFARGGVGPELTREGNSYPWFIKQSIVWPQADLPTSTMPNYHLDHEELQDLVTYLLGQTGDNKSISPTQYFKQVQEWEAGKKMAWEKPITPAQMQDVRFAMTVFATQGCSACHRLKGFESDVGYRVELNAKPDFDILYKEKQWFTSLVPEMIVGSSLVKVLETHGEEIDKHIVDGVRKGSIVEEIDQILPGQIESLYTDFKFAARAKNHEYQNKEDELKAWKERVHRVLMMFIQEYGFGRLIGPRPNWSGVYRSDEWLMEHFHSPSQHVARSIMPVMPFDDTKFYALTHMLDVLGKQNRDAVREIWAHQGFNPEMAFQIHCAQCHGEYKQGNGPVSLWIYPIPKNLNNADFLRNLTKEKVIQSITHGVSGTPMPPWGEVGAHKPYLNNIPVLNESEIKQLANWIFSSLPGGQVIKGSKDVQKWNYSPEDVIRELNEEGNKLKSSLLFNLPSGKGLLVSLQPVVDKSNAEEAIFEKKPNPIPGEDPWNYYIKKKYYTDENIAAGKAFFEMNCAVCHGTEADGSGARAQQMWDAKPRMLVNLDWSKSRDDLRLLRSIKYGVPGTAMTPWGDLTSSLQRLQLVMFIRSLSEDHLLREELSSALYQAYDHSILTVEKARVYEYTALAKAQDQYNELHTSRENLSTSLDDSSAKKILEIYQKELEALAQLKKRQEIDQILLNLRKEISNEKEIYQRLGLLLLGTPLEENDFHQVLKIISLNQDHYTFENSKLELKSFQEKEIATLIQSIEDEINSKVETLQKNKIVLEGKIFSIDQMNEIKNVQTEIDNYTKLKNNLISGFEEAKRSRLKQKSLFNEYHLS